MDNRLKSLIPYLISMGKFCFVEGRQVLDGVILVHEVTYSLKVTTKLDMLLKLDILKDYDKLR